jgi:acetyl esterase/lipase
MKKLILFFLVPIITFAQQNEIPRDTSFNTRSTAEKIIKSYPFAELVRSEIPDGVQFFPDVVYASQGTREMHIDIFCPVKGSGLHPAVLIIHGGGWRSGDKSMEWPTAQFVASHGYVTATVEYRLSPEAMYPEGIYDLKAAIRFLRANADKYKIDKNRIVVSGCSAGGELAAFLGTTGDLEKFEGPYGNSEFSTSVQAVISVDGIMDFTNSDDIIKDSNQGKPSGKESWFGSSFEENPYLWIEASPINYINSTTPPFCFINSSLPKYHAGRDYAIEKFKIHKIYSEVHTVEDTPHPFWLFHPWFDKTMEHMLGFLDKIFKGE